jgi:hypothetical protein
MRLPISSPRIVALAIVLAGSALAGVSVTQAGAADAATNPAVTIRAVDREGKTVAVSASLQSVVFGPAGIDDTLTSAHPTRVPRGSYNIAAWVYEPDGSAQTLVDRELTVTTSGTVTFDARKGRLIRFTVNDPAVAQDEVFAEPYSPNGYTAFDGYSPPSAQAIYAVPGTMAPGYYLALQADLVVPNESPSPVEYELVRQLKRTIPANLTFAVSKATLASDHVTVKAIDPGATQGITFRPFVNQDTGILPAISIGQSAIAPFSIDFYLTPGYQYESQTFSGTDNIDGQPVLRVRHYSQTFDNATFGPSPELGPLVTGNQILTTFQFGDFLFDDPTQQLDTSFGLQGSTGQTWLYEGTKLIAHSVNGHIDVTVSATPHWYTMRFQASRSPGATLWKSETLSFNFRSQVPGATVDNFWPRIIPNGLSLWNTVRHGTRTAVRIYFSDGVDISAHNVRVWASSNGGKTWQALRAVQSGPHWSVVVANPATAGFVSLRVQGTDSDGFTAAETVINAYAVS